MQGLFSRAHANPLELTYYSCVPYALGAGQAMKYSMRPVVKKRGKVPARPGPNYLREAMANTLASEEVVFDFLVQLQTDPRRMPIEDASVIWPERLSPSRKVATLRIPVQSFTSGRTTRLRSQALVQSLALVAGTPAAGQSEPRAPPDLPCYVAGASVDERRSARRADRRRRISWFVTAAAAGHCGRHVLQWCEPMTVTKTPTVRSTWRESTIGTATTALPRDPGRSGGWPVVAPAARLS